MTGLDVARGLVLPLDFVTQPNALLAMRGAGKSNAAVRMAEQLYKHGLPFVVIDPKGDWWGMRSSCDGKREGLPIPIFGGLHGDTALGPHDGHLIAETVVELNLTCILDVSEFDSKADQVRFLTDFAQRLFRLHGKHPHPRHLFLEEADDFIPQREAGPQRAACTAAWTKIVKQGRSRGLGITIVTQRSAVVSKDALTQVENLFAMRATSPQDRAAIKAWVDYHDAGKELVDSLPSLAAGEAWVISPHWLGRIERIKFKQRETFDSGATPQHGATRQAANLADVDLDVLRGKLAVQIERVENEDPKRLQARIRELVALKDRLERELDAARQEARVEYVDRPVPVIPPLVEQAVATLSVIGDDLAGAGKRVIDLAVELGAAVTKADTDMGAVMGDRLVVEARKLVDRAERRPTTRVVSPGPRERADIDPDAPKDVRFGRAEKKILSVLVQFPQGRTHRQLAMLTGYSPKASTIGVAMSRLRKLGYAEEGQPLKATSAGHEVMVGHVEPLPAGPALLAHWKGQLKASERAVLDALIKAYPGSLTQPELAELTGYSPEASTIGVALSKLRGLELVDRNKVSDDFWDAIR